MTYTLSEILAAYKDCGINYAQAMNLITSNPPVGLGYPTQTAMDYLNNEQRNCGSGTKPDPTKPDIPAAAADDSLNRQYPSIPDNFYGFLLLLGGLR